ncbi:MAG: endonuclease VIII [Balneolaceae bacterium]|nr:endonuclease VIII [Balneolaceae bacterium]
MPEGPEIWRTADRLSDALVGHAATGIYFAFDHLKQYEEQLAGRKVREVEPKGKAIITRFDNGLNIYSHNQLYGKWIITDGDPEPDTNRQLRVTIRNSSHEARLYSASDIEVLDDDGLRQHNYLNKLGPDLLHPEVGFEEVYRQITDNRYQNRKLATLLLDQGFLSGVGNYLRSEILFYAGINPESKLGECSESRKKELADAALKMARRSYETGGITNDPRIVEALKREGSKRKNYRHFVYGRENRRCHKCGTVIELNSTGGRKIYYCPECQSVER